MRQEYKFVSAIMVENSTMPKMEDDVLKHLTKLVRDELYYGWRVEGAPFQLQRYLVQTLVKDVE